MIRSFQYYVSNANIAGVGEILTRQGNKHTPSSVNIHSRTIAHHYSQFELILYVAGLL